MSKYQRNIMLKKFIKVIIISTLAVSIMGCSNKSSAVNSDKSPVSSEFEVSYINVGDGNSTLVEVDGKSLLIDSGNDTNVKNVISYLNNKGIKKIDYLIGSNYYQSDVGGMRQIIDNFEIGKLYLTKNEDFDKDERKNIEDKVKEKKLVINDIKVGEDPGLELGKAKIDVLAPIDDKEIKKSGYNSLVMKITYGDTSFLFAGSADQNMEKKLIDLGANLKANVLKVSNSGSDKGTSNAFVKKVTPEIAIISVEKGDNKNPGKGTLSTLEGENIKLYRTDFDNNIVIKSDGKNVSRKNS